MTHEHERDLIEAIGNKTAREVAKRLIDEDSPKADLAEQVIHATHGIIGRVAREVEQLELIDELAEAGLESDPSGQLHHIKGSLRSWEDAAPAVAKLRESGWVTWHDLVGSAEVALYRSVDRVTLAHLEDAPITLELTWTDSPFMRAPEPLRPSVSDVSLVELPEPLWPLYAAVRPLRLLGERLGRVTPRSRSLGPILSTPRGLIRGLLELAEVTADDHLIDLGCGEGRVVVEAARHIGCRVTGVETDARLVERARASIAEELDGDARAEVVHGDASSFDLGDATVVFLFIPADAISEVVRQLRAQGFDGRIVSHEQVALPLGLAPTSSHVLTTDGALTVAHLW